MNVEKRARFPGGVFFRCTFRLLPALRDLVLDRSAAGGCAPSARLWERKAVMMCRTP